MHLYQYSVTLWNENNHAEYYYYDTLSVALKQAGRMSTLWGIKLATVECLRRGAYGTLVYKEEYRFVKGYMVL